MTKIIINFEYDEPILTSNTADKKRRNELFKALVKGLKFFLVSDCMEYDDADNNIKFLWKGDDVIFVKGCTCVDCEEAEGKMEKEKVIELHDNLKEKIKKLKKVINNLKETIEELKETIKELTEKNFTMGELIGKYDSPATLHRELDNNSVKILQKGIMPLNLRIVGELTKYQLKEAILLREGFYYSKIEEFKKLMKVNDREIFMNMRKEIQNLNDLVIQKSHEASKNFRLLRTMRETIKIKERQRELEEKASI